MTVDLPELTFEKTQKTLQKLKNSKAGCDIIIADHLKYGGNALHQQIHKLIILIWTQEKKSNRKAS